MMTVIQARMLNTLTVDVFSHDVLVVDQSQHGDQESPAAAHR